jgi:signal transduction histidine kinase
VVANLLSNATKFTPESGRIAITIDPALMDGKAAVMVSVKDSGPGVPKEAQGKLFSKFQQVEKGGAKSEQKGSGLGLALVREIVEHHEGRVGLESEPGQGTRFYFVLPIINKGDAGNEKDPHRG